MSMLWTLSEFTKHDPERGAHLSRAPPWPELIVVVRHSLRAALLARSVRFGLDESGRDPRELRGVIQFSIGRQVFDWLFNGLTGYRAQFRIGSDNGLAKNDELIAELRAELAQVQLRDTVIHRLSSDFTYKESRSGTIGEVTITLEPRLSKVWVCDKLIGEFGHIQALFVSRTGPQLNFAESESWSSLYPEDADEWLDVKGAFMSPAGPYQLKTPEARARNLEERGSA